ncbi:hypothetical protein OH77DRAFT_1525941 [Trametes cingulata]|nr:hypothetical protein OH77DRAFT_1525941 [Trametes cingulata]
MQNSLGPSFPGNLLQAKSLCIRYATNPEPTPVDQNDNPSPTKGQETASEEAGATGSNSDVVIPDPPPQRSSSALSRSAWPAASTVLSHTSSSPPPESDAPESSPREPAAPLADDDADVDALSTFTDTAHLPSQCQYVPTTVDGQSVMNNAPSGAADPSFAADSQLLQPTEIPIPPEIPIVNNLPLNMFAFPQQMYGMDMLGDGMQTLGGGMHAFGHGMRPYGGADFPFHYNGTGGMGNFATFSAGGPYSAGVNLFDGAGSFEGHLAGHFAGPLAGPFVDPFADPSAGVGPRSPGFNGMFYTPPDPGAADGTEEQRRSSRTRRPPRARDVTPQPFNSERPPKKPKIA